MTTESGQQSTSSAAANTYALGQSRQETERLMLSAQRSQLPLGRWLKDAGLRPGMKVLDVGAGAGDISLLAAEIVGSEGEVLGIDNNPSILNTARERAEQSGLRNVWFADMNVPAGLDELTDDFDAVIGRRVLCYIPEVALALRRLSDHLKPGGLMAFQEIDMTFAANRSEPASQLSQQLDSWMQAGFAAGGADPGMGRRLYHVFLAAGLVAPEMRGSVVISGNKESLNAGILGLLRALRPVILERGIASEDELDLDRIREQLLKEIDDKNLILFRNLEVEAWSRKPL